MIGARPECRGWERGRAGDRRTGHNELGAPIPPMRRKEGVQGKEWGTGGHDARGAMRREDGVQGKEPDAVGARCVGGESYKLGCVTILRKRQVQHRVRGASWSEAQGGWLHGCPDARIRPNVRALATPSYN